MAQPLRIGTLGAAMITPAALTEPASHNNDVVVAAIAARDPNESWGIRFATWDRNRIRQLR